MQQINNGFNESYYLTEDGRVYNSERKIYMKSYKNNFKLMKGNERVSISLKKLYLLVYGKPFCNDYIDDL